MKSILLLTALIILLGCQASGGGGGEVVSNHVSQDLKFTVSTQLNRTYINNDNIDVFLTFPSAVTVSGTPFVNLSIGSSTREAHYVSGSGSSSLIFRYTVAGTDNDLDGIAIANTISLNGGTLSYTKSDGTVLSCLNTLTPPSLNSVKVDTAVPSITSITPPPDGTYFFNMPMVFRVNFSENVSVTGVPRLAINMGGVTRYANYVSGSGSSVLLFQYPVSVTDVDSDGIVLSSAILLNGGAIKDSIHNANLTFTAPNTTSVLVAGVNPVVTFVTAPANGTYTNSQNLDFNLTFNKIVNITGSPRLILTVGSSIRYATYLSGSGTANIKFRYTATGNDTDTDGVSLSNVIEFNGGSIADADSNPAIPAMMVPSLTGVRVASKVPFSILAVAIPSSPPASGYDVGQNIDFTVTFSEDATESGGVSRLKIDINGVTRYANYLSGSGTQNLIYRYTVVANEQDLNGITLSSPLDLNTSTLTNAESQSPVLTFSVPVTTSILVDSKSPAILAVTPPLNGAYPSTQNLDFDVTFDEPVVISGTPRLMLTIGGATRYANYISGSLTPLLKFRYTVGANDNDNDGILLNTNIDLNAGSIKDGNNHNASLALVPTNTSGIIIDNTLPVISMITPPSNDSYGIGEILTFIANFSEIVTVTGSPRIRLSIGTATKYAAYVSGSGTNALTFSYTVVNGDTDSDGISLVSPLDLNGGTITDIAQLNSLLSFTSPDTSGVIVSTSNPTITAVTLPAEGKYTTGQNVDFSITFSEAVVVTPPPRIELTLASGTAYANYVSGGGTNTLLFRYTVAPGDIDQNGIIMQSPLQANGGAIQNLALSLNANLTFDLPDTSGIQIDGIDPVISSITPPASKTYIPDENLDFVVNYSANVDVTGSPKLNLIIGNSLVTASYHSGSGTNTLTFRYTVVSGNTDIDGIAITSPLDLNGGLIADQFNDSAGLTFSPPTTSGILVDGIAPSIIGVTPPSPGTYYINETMDFDVSFSDAVVITGSPVVSILIGTANKVATYLSGSGTNTIRFRYTAGSGDYDPDGISVISPLDLKSGGIKDISGNDSGLAFNPPDASSVKVDTSSVEITAIQVSPGKYNTGNFLDVYVTFERTVHVTGTPQARITIGSTTVNANYVSGSGTSTLIFRHIVAAGNIDTDGVVLVSPFVLNGGSIQDNSNQNANLVFSSPDTSSILVDGIDLEIISVTPPADKTYVLNQDIIFDVTYNHPAIVTGAPRIPLTVGSNSVFATYASGSGTSTLKFKYTVAPSDLDSDGVILSSPLDLNSGTIQDAFSDNAALTFTAENYPGVKTDGMIPTITTVTGPTDGTYDSAQTLSFTVNFSEDINVTGTPRIGLTIGSTIRYATYQSGSGSSATFSYTLAGSDNDSDGIIVTSPLQLNSGTISDIAGNSISDLSFTSPITSGIFVAGNVADPANSTITGTGPVLADGVATSTISITLKNSANNSVVGVVPTLTATDTGTTNLYGTCSATDSSGLSTCTLRSTRAELKILSIASPITKTGGNVEFIAGSAVAINSTITGSGPVIANGVATSTVTITLRDAFNNGVPGIVPTFSATNTGTTNVYGTCSSTSATGVSTCTLASTRAESKVLSIATPTVKAGGTVVFQAGPAASSKSYITGTTPVSSDGISTSFIEISLRDDFNNPVQGVIPIYNATDTGTTNVYGACSATNASGISACTLASTTAELKTLQLTSPVGVTGNTVEFSSSLPTSQNSSITASGPVVADGVTISTVTITLRDANNNLVTLDNGALPDFAATDTAATNAYSECANTEPGVYTCTFTSRKAETKTLSITGPVNNVGGTVIFTAGPAASSFSTITGTGPTIADNTAVSTITITIKDQYNNSVSGSLPTFSATNTGSTNVMTACTSSDIDGVSTCTLKSTVAETKTLALVTPVVKTGGTVVFIGGTPVATNSSITGTGPVSPDGVAKSTITITLRDTYNNLSPGVTPGFTATGTTNTYGTCPASSSSGISTCTLSSTTAEIKTLSITTPFVKAGGTVEFLVGAPVAENSTITGTGPVVANGTATSTVTITLRDASNSPSPGITPTFSATGTNNTYGVCTVSNASGISTCNLASTKAEEKILSITAPFVKEDAAVSFIAGPAFAANSSISAADGTLADGVDTCEVTVTIKDAFNNAVEGSVPTYSMTGTLNNLLGCTASDATGLSTCLATSTKAEAKQVSLLTPVAKAGNTVDFNPYGINIQVPVEMADLGLASNTATITFNRTRTSLNTADYISQSNKFSFEIIAQNSNTTTSYSVSLVNGAGANIADSVILIPANTTSPTRFRVQFTPTTGNDNYRVRLNATTLANQVIVHTARMIVSQYRAIATKIYIPLTQGLHNSPSNLDTNAAAISSLTGSNQYQALYPKGTTTGTPGTASYWNKVPSNYDAILTTAGDAFTLETVMSSSSSNRIASMGLFNRTMGTPTLVTGAESTFAGLTISMVQKNFANNAVNFTDNNQFELRGKISQTAGTAHLYKAGLWIKLKYLKRAEIYNRLALRRAFTALPTSALITQGRFLWEASEWSNPGVFLEINGQNPTGSTSSVQLADSGASDSSITGTAVSGSTLTPGTSYTRQRSGALSLTNLNSYTVQHDATLGSPTLGSAFLVIQAGE